MLYERIYIVGFMGSGKTTAGRKLASMLGWSFIDLDEQIEKKISMTIPEIFARLGENTFRKTESEVLREAGQMKNAVVSTGGGAPCHDSNMDYMLETGITVYLKLTPGQLRSRLQSSGTVRPLIKGLENGELLHFIRHRLTQREEYYSRAEIIMEGSEVDLVSLEKLIMERL